MIISRENLIPTIEKLRTKRILACDTETTGLRAYQDDYLFSIIISDDEKDYYFNFQDYGDLTPRLPRSQIKYIFESIDRSDTTWVFHNAAFDLAMLGREGVELKGSVWCTMVGARLVHNDHMSYSLDNCVKRDLGEEKDDAVMKYIREHKLWEWETIPGKKQRGKKMYFDKVDPAVIVPYGEKDARLTHRLQAWQKNRIDYLVRKGHTYSPETPNLNRVLENEQRLAKTCLRMQQRGVMIDVDYCQEAIAHYSRQIADLEHEWQERTSRDFIDSGKEFKVVLGSDQVPLTEKGNPSYTSENLGPIESPLAKLILSHRSAKKYLDYFQSFLYFKSPENLLHPNFNQAGTKTGRFSSSAPNLQNLTKDADTDASFPVRRALVPRPGYRFYMLDYDQQEYRLMLDYAGAMGLIEKVLNGLDVHTATADIAGITRKQAKTTNFGILYGIGLRALSEKLGTNVTHAKEIKQAIFAAAPEINLFINRATDKAMRRGFVVNWLGRHYQFDNRFAYRAPNAIIQGGGADCIKVAMNRIDELLLGKKSCQLLQVHDELILEVHESEEDIVGEVKDRMEKAYPHRYLPLTVGVDFSDRSIYDKKSIDQH